ncbi:MAG: hypothetical protein H7146_12470 [Burkholderiaceae bacterium]|nr:hypothetical protein [Microbacteriaceae bacterium]
MTSDRDDDALSWGGEAEDPSYLDGPAAAADDAPAIVEALPATSALSSVLLVTYGILGGVYLLYSVGWIISIQRDTFTASNLFFEIMYQLGEFLAIAAPVLWIFLAFLLTRDRRAVLRLAWLVGGIVLLAPWPFILSGSSS